MSTTMTKDGKYGWYDVCVDEIEWVSADEYINRANDMIAAMNKGIARRDLDIVDLRKEIDRLESIVEQARDAALERSL